MITKNYLAFGLEFFSIKETARSLFSPWRRYTWNYDRGFDLGKYFETALSNVVTRVIGFAMRVFLITFFLIYEVFVLAAGMAMVIIFTAYPALAVYGIIYSFKFL